jgi:hypothetical protein
MLLLLRSGPDLRPSELLLLLRSRAALPKGLEARGPNTGGSESGVPMGAWYCSSVLTSMGAPVCGFLIVVSVKSHWPSSICEVPSLGSLRRAGRPPHAGALGEKAAMSRRCSAQI